MAMELRKAGSIWVDGDRFFDREVELASLSERVSDGIHTLLTAQRRMGKTSLVREMLRRLADGDDHETIFVDFEDAETAEDAVAELAISSRVSPEYFAKDQSRVRQCPAGAGAKRRGTGRLGVKGEIPGRHRCRNLAPPRR